MKRRYSLPLQPNGEPADDESVTFREIQEGAPTDVILFGAAAQRNA